MVDTVCRMGNIRFWWTWCLSGLTSGLQFTKSTKVKLFTSNGLYVLSGLIVLTI